MILIVKIANLVQIPIKLQKVFANLVETELKMDLKNVIFNKSMTFDLALLIVN